MELSMASAKLSLFELFVISLLHDRQVIFLFYGLFENLNGPGTTLHKVCWFYSFFAIGSGYFYFHR